MMTIIEKPDIRKFFAGIICSIFSAWIANFILGPAPDMTNLFWFVPGLTFALALVIPNVLDINGIKWKLISIAGFAMLAIVVWILNVFIVWVMGSVISNTLGLIPSLIFIGFFSSISIFGAFNFFFARKIKRTNYFMVGIFGGLSFFLTDRIVEGQGLINHFDKLIYVWQTLVGIGISLTYKKENLFPFIN